LTSAFRFRDLSWIIVLLVGLVFMACDERNNMLVDTIPDAPEITLTLEQDSVAIGDTVRITLEATSEVGLTAIWWTAEREDLGHWSLAHMHYCDSTAYEKVTWEVVADTVLNFRLGANARDYLYGNGMPHQASDAGPIPWTWLYITPTPEVP